MRTLKNQRFDQSGYICGALIVHNLETGLQYKRTIMLSSPPSKLDILKPPHMWISLPLLWRTPGIG